MPTPEEILNGLTLASNKFVFLSIAWHIIVLLFIALLIAGKRPSSKAIALGLIALFLSVSIVAMLVSNPFNGAMFMLASVWFIYISWKMPEENVIVKWDIVSLIGVALIGLFYGIFGVLRLKVYLDVVLIAGALFLLIYALTLKKPGLPDPE